MYEIISNIISVNIAECVQFIQLLQFLLKMKEASPEVSNNRGSGSLKGTVCRI